MALINKNVSWKTHYSYAGSLVIKANIVIIGDIVRIMQNRPKLVSLEIVRDIGDGDGGGHCMDPIYRRGGSLFDLIPCPPVAVCLTVRLERNKSARRGGVGNPSPTTSSPPLHFHVTVRMYVLRNTILSPANSALRQTHQHTNSGQGSAAAALQ